MTHDEIEQLRSKVRNKFNKWARESGMDKAVENISRAIRELKDADMDVGIDMIGCPSEMAFATTGYDGVIVPLSGIVSVGSAKYLVALITSKNGHPCMELALSEFDIAHQGPAAILKDSKKIVPNIRHQIFDLRNDPNAIKKFQEEIIKNAVRDEFLVDHDVAGAFDGTRTLAKRVLKAAANG